MFNLKWGNLYLNWNKIPLSKNLDHKNITLNIDGRLNSLMDFVLM